jgi:hypothetical protein
MENRLDNLLLFREFPMKSDGFLPKRRNIKKGESDKEAGILRKMPIFAKKFNEAPRRPGCLTL